LNIAEKLNKRIIPTLHREFDPKLNSSNSISKINWLFFRDEDNFTNSFDSLMETINKDLEWVKFHTRLLVRAGEWASRKNDGSYHLYGKDLEEALSFVNNEIKKSPPLNTLQKNYIESSKSGAARLRRPTITRVLCSSVNLFHCSNIRNIFLEL
jgi:hypothetical protein